MKTKFGKWIAGAVAFCMVLATVLAVPFGFLLPASAESAFATFSSGAVLIDSSYNGKNVIIKNGVFSVTVVGATNVTLLFEGVTMDRRYSTDTQKGQQIDGLIAVANALGWAGKEDKSWDWGNAYYVTTYTYQAQVSPFLITNNSEVKVAFRGANKFYAGVNGSTVSSKKKTNASTYMYENLYTASENGGGYAGIQVERGSTLTIEQSQGTLEVYGGHYVEGDNSENYEYKYGTPDGAVNNSNTKYSGGAGIGGGVTYNTTNCFVNNYTQGTPGTIIINGGTIEAYGGHQAAGIGGGVNGAATSTSITVNGGTIIAKGGRWAAGIGDGDSLSDGSNYRYSPDYYNDYSVNISGGYVEAIGGVACPGIGCTDTLKNVNKKSAMTIRLTGGTIKARSGYPDGFNPNQNSSYNKEDAAAGIGAGNNSQMEPQSIIIAKGSNIIAASFGHYAITENGIDQTAVPQISLEQNRMYNGRFPELVSSDDRTFTLYEAQRETILSDEVEGEFIAFMEQKKDGTPGQKYYYDSDRFLLLDENKVLLTPLTNTNAQNQAIVKEYFEGKSLTLYVDENSKKIETVLALKHFKSIAMTLPDPALHGGIYALEIPASQILNPPQGVTLPDKIHVTISALSEGNIWGSITYPVSNNLKLDAVSASFGKLDVYPDAEQGSATDNGLIGTKYSESMFAYSVYIESDATVAYLYGAFVNEDGVTYRITIDGNDQTISNKTETIGGKTVSVNWFRYTVDMTGKTQRVLQLEKTDTNGSVKAHSVIYKITVNRKAVYEIRLKPLDKIYDGNRVVPVIESVVEKGTNNAVTGVTADELKSATYSYGEGTMSGSSVAPKDAGTYTVAATINAETYTALGGQTFTIAPKALTVTRIGNYLLYVKSSDYETWKDQGTYTISGPGAIFLSGLVKNESVTLTHGNVYYNDLSIGYGATKITLENVQISGDAAKNYTIDQTQTVFGQINYSLDGAIFRSEDGGSWDKFYPIDSENPVNSTSADYHSPKNADGSYTSHAEYVWARTQGGGTAQAVYAMEIEFGAMYFNYTKEVWNTDSMKYEEAENGESFWIGFDGKNNCVTVVNRSNAAIFCNVKPEISFIYASHDGGQSGIVAKVYTKNEANTNYLVTETEDVTVPQATPPETVTGTGTATRQSFYLILSGNPQSGNTDRYIAVGDMIVTVKKSSD